MMIHDNYTDWVVTNCHQVPNPPEQTKLMVAFDECMQLNVYWLPYKQPLRNPKWKGRYVDEFGNAIAHGTTVQKWRIDK